MTRHYPSALPITDGVTWVGVFDPNLIDFHGFILWDEVKGSTYGSYLVQGADKVALVDVVNEEFVPEYLARVSEVVDLDQIDYLVVNHVEPDHFGGLLKVREALPNAELYCSAAAARTIPEFHGIDVPAHVVADGDTIDLGGKVLEFLPVPMVHWPDSMFTYVRGANTLICNDAFGQHIGIPGTIFSDEVPRERLIESADLYYSNILSALATPISTALTKVAARGWEIDFLAPAHGLVYRGADVGMVLDRYRAIVSGALKEHAITIAYSTAWHSTELLADYIAERLSARGYEVRTFNVNSDLHSRPTLSLLTSDALIVGAPTMHNGMLYRTASFLQYISGLKPQVKLAAVFGSYGWSGGATKQARAMLEAMGCSMPISDLQVKFRPTELDHPAIDAWIEEFIGAYEA